ncbi:single-stranded DNA-binding protein [bacterium]|nr:single-stranded DNA-binding protein [bacterium]
MALAKIVVDGIVVKTPEKRFTQNNLPITNFTLNINQKEETLVRVIAIGNLAEVTAQEIAANDRVIVDGRLQVETFKTQDGKDKRIIEINASTIEKIGGTQELTPKAAPKNENIVQFADQELVEDLIDEDEIPF